MIDTEWADDPGIYRIGISDQKLSKVADLNRAPEVYDDCRMWGGMTPLPVPQRTIPRETRDLSAIEKLHAQNIPVKPHRLRPVHKPEAWPQKFSQSSAPRAASLPGSD